MSTTTIRTNTRGRTLNTKDRDEAKVEMVHFRKGTNRNGNTKLNKPEVHLINNMTPEQERACGMITVPCVHGKPDVNRDNDDDDTTLPLEKEVKFPPEIIANPAIVDPEELKEVQKETGNFYDDMLNDLGQGMYRDNDNRVNGTEDMVAKINHYNQSDVCMTCGDFCGYVSCIVTLGMYPCCNKRRVIGPDQLGEHRRNGRTLLHLPGRHVLFSCNDTWVDRNGNRGLVPKDDEKNKIRDFGNKKVVVVGENELGGARYIGCDKEGVNDGDYVILGQGRHVLDESSYSNIDVVNLKTGESLQNRNNDEPNNNNNNNNRDEARQIKLGPLTVVYVREGYVGGAEHIASGRYKILLPGPPYILHNKNFANIHCVKRQSEIKQVEYTTINKKGKTCTKSKKVSTGTFKLGPITFLVVGDGQIGGAVHKHTGMFQVLSPGNTYMLHDKDYKDCVVVDRTEEFEHGPFYYINIPPGWVGGARRKKGEKWIDFETGFTYQCNKDDYFKPERKKLDSHHIKCGPKTYLTIKKGTKNGAYSVKTGEWIEFNDESKTYILHEKEYRDIQTIPLVADEEQEFGPYKVMTIKEGYAGIVQNQGKMLEPLKPGTYQLSNDHEFSDPIPLRTWTLAVKDLPFNSKDLAQMELNANFIWFVNDPSKVAIFKGGFEELQKEIEYQVKLQLSVKCATYSRAEILPAEQDSIISRSSGSSPEELAKTLAEKDAEKHRNHAEITNYCLERLKQTAEDCNWGIEIKSLVLKGFILKEKTILDSFAQMTQNIVASQKAQAEAEENKRKQQAEAEVTMQRTRNEAQVAMQKTQAETEVSNKRQQAEAEIAMKKAKADGEVVMEKARVEAEANKQRDIARAQAEVEVAKANKLAAAEKARADTEACIIRAEAEAKERSIKLEIENKEKLEKARTDNEAVLEHAKAEAEAQNLQTDADFKKKKAEHDAAQMVPEYERELKKWNVLSDMYQKVAQSFSKATFYDSSYIKGAVKTVEDLVGQSLPNMMKKSTVITDVRDHDRGNTGKLTIKSTIVDDGHRNDDGEKMTVKTEM